jgi:hypothetical protein
MGIPEALVLDVCAVEQLLTRSFRPVPPRLIIPARAFVDRAGSRRLVGFQSSGWSGKAEVLDVIGLDQIQCAVALRKSGLTDCQAAGIVIAQRERAHFVGDKCEVLTARAEPFLGFDGVIDVGALWPVLWHQ